MRLGQVWLRWELGFGFCFEVGGLEGEKVGLGRRGVCKTEVEGKTDLEGRALSERCAKEKV